MAKYRDSRLRKLVTVTNLLKNRKLKESLFSCHLGSDRQSAGTTGPTDPEPRAYARYERSEYRSFSTAERASKNKKREESLFSSRFGFYWRAGGELS